MVETVLSAALTSQAAQVLSALATEALTTVLWPSQTRWKEDMVRGQP